MGSLYGIYKSDQTKEVEGSVVNFGPCDINGLDITITVGRAGGANKAYQKALANKMRPYRKQAAADMLAVEVMERVIREVYAETVIKSWENVFDEEGNLLEFNVENVIQVLKDLPDLFAVLQEHATMAANFRGEASEEIAKN